MPRPRPEHLAFGVAYFAAAGVTIALTRLDGGVSLVWIATALLTAKLRTTDRRSWPWWLGAAGAGSMLATGAFGLGWEVAPAMMVLNLLDALIAERVLSHAESRHTARPAELRGPAIVAACLAGAIATMIPAGVVTTLAAGTPMLSNAANWLVGHALGSLVVGPFMFFCMRGHMRPWITSVARCQDLPSLTAMVLLVMACVLAFQVANFSLLFLPVLALAALTYRAGLQGAAFGSVLLGVIGTAFTVAGQAGSQFGPPMVTFQFFQFFLGMTTLTMLPLSAVVSARKSMDERVRHSEAGYRLLADNIEDVVVSVDTDGRLTYASPSIRNFSGQQPADVIGHPAADLMDARFHRGFREARAAMLRAGGDPVSFEFVANTDDGSKRWFELQGRIMTGSENEQDGIVATIRETTSRKMLEAALTSAAETDAFTGLLNRRAFFDAARATQGSGLTSYLALFDVDHLSSINAMVGYGAGDEVLLAFSRVSRNIVRKCDLVGRLEGDRFGVLLPNTSCEQAETACQRLLAAFAGERLVYGGQRIVVTASAGLAAIEHGVEASTHTAHAALSLAKKEGRGRLQVAADTSAVQTASDGRERAKLRGTDAVRRSMEIAGPLRPAY
jgi:diguanylate cyclase (GGDEF)-like protein/PAS domain S-box-containing protein